MKSLNLLLVVCACMAAQFISAKATTEKKLRMNVATFNIRLQTSGDSADRAWDNRKTHVAKLINDYNFDIFGVQEIGSSQQKADLGELIPGYTYFGRGRDDQKGTEGEQLGIFYKTDRFTIRDYGFFFLSETPDMMSRGWDAALRRVCVWTKLIDKQTYKPFYVFCTHFDHVGVKAREESARLLVEKVKEIAEDAPVLCVGDLNTSPESSGMYKTITGYLDDSHEVPGARVKGSVGTFNGYDVSRSTFPSSVRIDYILSRKVKVFNYAVLNDRYSSKTYPSDHFPVMIKCQLISD